MARCALGLMFGLTVCWAGAAASELSVEPDSENVVSSRLEGDWQVHPSLTQRLTGRAEAPFAPRISIRVDKSVVAQVPARYGKYFAQHGVKVYMAGYLTFPGTRHPFLLTTLHGNPYIFYFRETNGDPFGNGESSNVMLAPAKEKANDLLFIGGDFNNQPFTAYSHVQTPDVRAQNNPGTDPVLCGDNTPSF